MAAVAAGKRQSRLGKRFRHRTRPLGAGLGYGLGGYGYGYGYPARLRRILPMARNWQHKPVYVDPGYTNGVIAPSMSEPGDGIPATWLPIRPR